MAPARPYRPSRGRPYIYTYSAPQLDAPDNLFRTLRPNIPADTVDQMKEEHYTQVRDLKSKIFH